MTDDAERARQKAILDRVCDRATELELIIQANPLDFCAIRELREIQKRLDAWIEEGLKHTTKD